MQAVECFVGKTLLRTVMVHRREEDLSCATLLCLMSPLEEHAFCRHTASVQIAAPLAILLQSGVDSTDTLLTAEALGDLCDQFRATHGTTVDRYLVCTRCQQSLHITELMDATAHGEWDRHLGSNTLHELGKGATPLMRSRDIKIYELISPHQTILLTQFDRITCVTEIDELYALYRLAIFHIEARNYTLS